MIFLAIFFFGEAPQLAPVKFPAKGPAPVKCPFGATSCTIVQSKTKVKSCWQSVLQAGEDENDFCYFNSSFDCKTILTTGLEQNHSAATSVITFCNQSSSFLYLDGYGALCVPSKINGQFLGHIEVKSSGSTEVVDACLNGYPSSDHLRCILKGDKDNGRDLANQARIPDPIGPNCAVGVRAPHVSCGICQDSEVTSCYKINREERSRQNLRVF